MNPLMKLLIKQIVPIIYKSALYPAAKKYVESTSNTYDDLALKFLDDFVSELIKKI